MLDDGVGYGGGSSSSKLAFSLEVKYDGIDVGRGGSSSSNVAFFMDVGGEIEEDDDGGGYSSSEVVDVVDS